MKKWTNTSRPTRLCSITVYFLYAKNTGTQQVHQDALLDPLCNLICCLFDEAGAPWGGETHTLKVMLIETTKMWEHLMGEGEGVVPCPVKFEPEDLYKTKELSKRLRSTSYRNFEACCAMVGFETETWVFHEHYEMALDLAELLKLKVLAKIPKGEARAIAEANWFLDDMDEKDYRGFMFDNDH